MSYTNFVYNVLYTTEKGTRDTPKVTKTEHEKRLKVRETHTRTSHTRIVHNIHIYILQQILIFHIQSCTAWHIWYTLFIFFILLLLQFIY
jgi:hypothetical protein